MQLETPPTSSLTQLSPCYTQTSTELVYYLAVTASHSFNNNRFGELLHAVHVCLTLADGLKWPFEELQYFLAL